MKSKQFGLVHFCTFPDCPAYGLYQEPLESLVALNQCVYCREGKEFSELFEIEINDSLFMVCNWCLHKEIKKLKTNKNTKKL